MPPGTLGLGPPLRGDLLPLAFLTACAGPELPPATCRLEVLTQWSGSPRLEPSPRATRARLPSCRLEAVAAPLAAALWWERR